MYHLFIAGPPALTLIKQWEHLLSAFLAYFLQCSSVLTVSVYCNQPQPHSYG